METSPVPPNHVEPIYSKVEPSSSRHRRHQSVTGIPIAGAQPQVPNNHVHVHVAEMDAKDILSDDLAVSDFSFDFTKTSFFYYYFSIESI